MIKINDSFEQNVIWWFTQLVKLFWNTSSGKNITSCLINCSFALSSLFDKPTAWRQHISLCRPTRLINRKQIKLRRIRGKAWIYRQHVMDVYCCLTNLSICTSDIIQLGLIYQVDEITKPLYERKYSLQA